MDNDKLKNMWNITSEFTDMPAFMPGNVDRFLASRSGSIYGKVRKNLVFDLFVKAISAMFIIADLVVYRTDPDVLRLCLALLILLLVTGWLQWKTLIDFDHVSDPGKSPRSNLADMTLFLERKYPILIIAVAFSQILVFIPGVLLYFYLFHGHIKPIEPMSTLVFTILCLFGFVFQLFNMRAQFRAYIRHLKLCLSDLNENALITVSQNLELRQKQDITIRMLVYFVLILAFVVLMAVLKSIVS